VFIEPKDDGDGGDNWTTGAVSRVKLQSNKLNTEIYINIYSTYVEHIIYVILYRYIITH